MSDDEDEGRLRIDEDSPGPFDEKPAFSAPSPSVSEPKKDEESDEKLSKEDGELDEEVDEPMDTTEVEKKNENTESSSIDPVVEVEKEKTPEQTAPESSSSAKKNGENGGMKPPQSTEKTPNHRKRKESVDNLGDKRKSGLETIASASSSTPPPQSTPQRSKRASSHMATVAISQCFTEEGYVSVPMMPIQRTPTDTPSSKRAKLSNASLNGAPSSSKDTANSSTNNNNHVDQNDASTNVMNTKCVDTSTLLSNESIMDAPAGSQMLLEVTVMYRIRNMLTFKINGSGMLGFLSDGLPPTNNSLAGTANANNNKKKSNNPDEPKDGRSSSASSNGRNGRGSSREPSSSKDKGKKDGKRKKEESVDKEEDPDEDQQPEVYGSNQCELVELNENEMHDCHFEGCEKRYHKAQELEYHITNNHKKKALVYESLCTQTDIIEMKEMQTETDEELLPQPQMPVLKKEEPIKAGGPILYEDLSDDDPEPKNLAAPTLAPASSNPSAAAALMGIAQASSSTGGTPVPVPVSQPVVRSSTSTPISAKIGINPAMIAQVNAQNAEKNKQRTVVQPQPHPVTSSIPSSSAQPPPGVIQAHPMQQFMGPPFHPSILHHPQMTAIGLDPRMTAALTQQQQQMSRTPSRQPNVDSHKIHELAKAKENEQRQRQQATTPKTSTPGGMPSGAPQGTPQRQFLPAHMMPPGTPQSIQQQQQQHQAAVAAQAHAAQAFAQVQAQQYMMAQMAQQQAAAQRHMQPSQQDLVAVMIALQQQQQMQLAPGAPPVFPGGPPQVPPK